MDSNLYPYLFFDGNAREAMRFYREALGGELTVMTYGETGVTGPEADQVMHATLASEAGYTIMASDTGPGQEYRPGRNVALCLGGDDGERLRGYWQRLAAGATVTVPLEQQFWGDVYGSLVDRFGVSWMVDISAGSS
ncbi:VOC family protein [Glycomyces sp. YM15]|uniref:VOC family protein n=1 Tax=Glycomyces sp. YM15 TaxID=2800446 RepID=UPI0019637193|nr:VOC family protein [Glycomyces sp. YM15]